MRVTVAIAFAIVQLGTLSLSAQTTLVQSLTNVSGASNIHAGQSFLTPNDGTNHTLTGFTFFYDGVGTHYSGGGLAYLFSTAYGGTAANLASSSPLAVSQTWSGSSYDFISGSLNLAPNTTYWIYTDSLPSGGGGTNAYAYDLSNPYSGGDAYFAFSGSFGLLNGGGADYNFRVTVAAIPESANVATGLALLALGAVGVRNHRRRKLTA